MKQLLTLILITISSNAWAATLSLCESVLTMNEPTKKIASYLGALVEKKLVSDTELTHLIDSIDAGSIENPISQEKASESSALLIHRKRVEQLLRADGITPELLRDWAWTALETKSRERVERDKVEEKTQTPIEAMVFHEVMINAVGHVVEVMNTPVTQQMWVELMGENPASFKEGPHTKEIEINGKRVRLQPNNPIENVTWYSAAVFANRLSEKHGFEPFYQFNYELFDKSSRAEDGTLRPTKEAMLKLDGDESALFAVLPENQNPTTSNGYRLPTDIERGFLQILPQSSSFPYFHFTKAAELGATAWHASNSGKQTQPVARLLPWIIQGKEFFDIAGNVNEWIEDRTVEQDLIVTPHREKLSSKRSKRKMHGGSWETPLTSMTTYSSASRGPENAYPTVGFRLVRTVK